MRIKLLDFMKGISILTIVLMHFMNELNLPKILHTAINFGGAGVHVFIFVSGFSLFLSSSKKQYSYFGFIKKRFINIYIPYIIAVLIIVALSFLVLGQKINWGALLSHLFLYKMFNNDYMVSYGFHLWFISTIFQLYLVMPLIIYLSKRFSLRKIFMASIIISILWICYITLFNLGDLIIWNCFFLKYLWEFVFGMYMCQLYLNNNLRIVRTSTLIFITLTSLVIYALFAIKFHRVGQNFNDLFSLFGYGGVCLLLYNINIKMINDGLIRLGIFSFSFYLYHVIILELFIVFLTKINLSYNVLSFIFLIIFTIAISIPLNNFNNKLVKRIETGFSFT